MAANTGGYAISDRAVRRSLAPRKEPYWTSLKPGRRLGLSVNKSWAWHAKFVGSDRRCRSTCLGIAADSPCSRWDHPSLTYDQAVSQAVHWFAMIEADDCNGHQSGVFVQRPKAGPSDFYTVGHAFHDWMEWKEDVGEFRRSMKTPYRMALRSDLGGIPLHRLEKRDIQRWHNWIASLPAYSTEPTRVASGDCSSEVARDRMRRRQRTANIYLDCLVAALNYAFNSGLADTDLAWRGIRKFPGASQPQPAFLSKGEIERLIAHCRPDLCALIEGVLYTGCRPSELVELEAGDAILDQSKLIVFDAKRLNRRTVTLGSPGSAWLNRILAHAPESGKLLRQRNGRPWNVNRAGSALLEERKRLQVDQPITLRNLRQHYATELFKAGVPLPVISSQLGHKHVLITARYYAHIDHDIVDETLRAYLD